MLSSPYFPMSRLLRLKMLTHPPPAWDLHWLLVWVLVSFLLFVFRFCQLVDKVSPALPLLWASSTSDGALKKTHPQTLKCFRAEKKNFLDSLTANLGSNPPPPRVKNPQGSPVIFFLKFFFKTFCTCYSSSSSLDM